MLRFMDVINISQGYAKAVLTKDYDNTITEMKALINEAYKNNIIVVCSCGNNGYKEDIDTVEIPAALDNSIAVGSVNKLFK